MSSQLRPPVSVFKSLHRSPLQRLQIAHTNMTKERLVLSSALGNNHSFEFLLLGDFGLDFGDDRLEVVVVLQTDLSVSLLEKFFLSYACVTCFRPLSEIRFDLRIQAKIVPGFLAATLLICVRMQDVMCILPPRAWSAAPWEEADAEARAAWRVSCGRHGRMILVATDA